jgi:hypothetical protein
MNTTHTTLFALTMGVVLSMFLGAGKDLSKRIENKVRNDVATYISATELPLLNVKDHNGTISITDFTIAKDLSAGMVEATVQSKSAGRTIYYMFLCVKPNNPKECYVIYQFSSAPTKKENK